MLMASLGIGKTRSTPRRTPINHQKDPLQTALLQLSRSRSIPIHLPPTQDSIRHHARIRRPPLHNSSPTPDKLRTQIPRRRPSGRLPRPSPKRRTHHGRTIPRKHQSNLPHRTRKRPTTPQLYILGPRPKPNRPAKATSRDPGNARNKPLNRSSKLPPILIRRHPRTTPFIPPRLTTNQPRNNLDLRARRGNLHSQSYMGRMECLRRTHRSEYLGIQRETIPP